MFETIDYKARAQEMEENYKNALTVIGLIANSMPQREIRIPRQLMNHTNLEGTRLSTYETFDEYVIKVEEMDV